MPLRFPRHPPIRLVSILPRPRRLQGIKMTDRNFENVLAGCFIALCVAVGRERAADAIDTLRALVGDHRTEQYERKFYSDLAASIEEALPPIRPDYAWLFDLASARAANQVMA